MQTRVDPTFLAEMERFALRFTCRDCVHFEPNRAACSLGFPCACHRDPPQPRVEVYCFCKTFELL